MWDDVIEHVSLREHACVSSRGAQSTELVWILDFKQILLLLLLLFNEMMFRTRGLVVFVVTYQIYCPLDLLL